VLDTFNTMIEEKSSMPKHQVYTDLFKFIDYILKQFFKCLGESPFLMVEALCNHGMRDWNRAFDSSSDESEGIPSKAATGRRVLKLPAEIEVKPGLSWSQRLGVAVGLLVDKGKSDLVNKVQDIMRTESATRTAIVLMNDDSDDVLPIDLESWLQHPDHEISEEMKAQLKQPSSTSLEKFQDHRVQAGDDNDFKNALARDAELHMLLRLLYWDSEEEYPGHLSWTIPRSRTHSELDVDIKVIDHFLINPLDHNGKAPAELTKRKRKRRTRQPSLTAEELALDDTSDEGKTTKKTSGKPRKPPVMPQYRSAEFVTLSDDEEDEERDRLFFERERKWRAQISGETTSAPYKKPRPTKKVTKKTMTDATGSPMDIGEQMQDGDRSLTSTSGDGSESDRDRGLRTTTSPPHSSPPSFESLNPSAEVVGLKRDAGMIDSQGDDGNEEDGISGVKRKPVKSRKLFIEDSDEES